jgi:hypothetical protein
MALRCVTERPRFGRVRGVESMDVVYSMAEVG